MTSKYSISFLLITLSLGGALLATFPEKAYASNNGEHSEQHSDEEGHIELSAEQASEAGIKNVFANAGQIKQAITVYGKSVVDPSATSQIRARFPGIITQLKVNVGDTVKAGEIVVEIESSDSLKRYKVTSPISGIVTSRYANPGELANEQALLTVENYSQLWVEYRIFPSQNQAISKGQSVTVSNEFVQAQSTVTHLLANKSQPFMVARVPLDNTQGQWSPGQMLSGTVVTSQTSMPLVVDNRAFQEIEGERVIFVKNDGGYEARSLTLGQTDGKFTQVISGLEAGEQYAVENSYLLKAELGKSSASHTH